MLTESLFKQIKTELASGKEVDIICNDPKRAVEIEKITYNFSGRLRVRLVEIKQ